MLRHSWLAISVLMAVAVPAITIAAPAWGFQDICPYAGQQQDRIASMLRIDYVAVPRIAAHYCSNVGRNAFNALGPDDGRKIYLGPIMGVAWANAGEKISPPGRQLQVAPISGFLYIIGPGGVSEYVFLRWGTDVEGR
jgi:hypothetical protein